MNKKKVIIPALALSVVLGGTAIGVHGALANEGDRESFATKISQRFNLNEEEVKTFLDERREERKEKMQERFESRLNEAVQNGDLTEDQKNLILEKKSEMQAERAEKKENGERPSKEEREEHRAELESWAQENGIDIKYLFGGRGHGHGPMNK